MDRLPKVTTPLTVAADNVPPSAPPEGLLPRATVTVPDAEGTVFPSASTKPTFTAGVMEAPTPTPPGWTTNASAEAAPGEMEKEALVASVRPGERAVSV